MSELVAAYAGRAAAWVPALSMALLALGLALLVWLRAGRKVPASEGRRRALRLVGRNAIGLAIAGLVVSLGPMRPLFGTSRKLGNALGKPVPDAEFEVVGSGARRRLGELRGSVVLVNLWATWCPPCLRELPVLDRLQAAYRERGLVVLTLTDEPADTVRAELERLAPRTLNGSVTSFGWLAIRDFRPFTLVVDREGVLRDYLFGEQSYETFEARVTPYV